MRLDGAVNKNKALMTARFSFHVSSNLAAFAQTFFLLTYLSTYFAPAVKLQSENMSSYAIIHEQKFYSPFFLNYKARDHLTPLIEGLMERWHNGALLDEDQPFLKRLEAFGTADMAYADSVPGILREIRRGSKIFRNRREHFLVRPLDIVTQERQVEIEGRKIERRLAQITAWMDLGKGLFRTHWAGSDLDRQEIVMDLVHLSRRIKENMAKDPQEIARLSVEYAFGSRQLLNAAKPLIVRADRSTNYFWKDGTLTMKKEIPFLTRRYTETDLLKATFDPLIEELLDRTKKRKNWISGDSELIPLKQRYQKAFGAHKNRIPSDHTGIKITSRGCYFLKLESDKQMVENRSDTVVALPTNKMPLVEQVFLQEWKLRTRLELEVSKHRLAGALLQTHFQGSNVLKRAIYREWIRIGLRLQDDEQRGPRELAIRMIMFAQADAEDPDKEWGMIARLYEL